LESALPEAEVFEIIGHSGTRLTATVNASGYDFSLHGVEGGTEGHLKRFLGCTLISLLPPEGLDEVVNDLASYWAYYAAPRTLPAAEEARHHQGVVVRDAAGLAAHLSK
jgi:hypothetical protein